MLRDVAPSRVNSGTQLTDGGDELRRRDAEEGERLKENEVKNLGHNAAKDLMSVL